MAETNGNAANTNTFNMDDEPDADLDADARAEGVAHEEVQLQPTKPIAI